VKVYSVLKRKTI